MKRLFALFAFIMLLGGLAFNPAQAAVVSCKPYTGTGTTSWPQGVYFQYCDGASTSSASFVEQALTELPNGPSANAAGLVIKADMISLYANGFKDSKGNVTGKGYYGVVYLFHTTQDWLNWAAAHGVDVPSTVSKTLGGVTPSDPTTQAPLYTVIVEVTGNGVNNGYGGVHNVLQGETVHEFGHWANYLMRAGATQTVAVSNSAFYQAEVAQDYKNLNLAANYPCEPANQHQGVFTHLADASSLILPSSTYYFICNGTPTGTPPAPVMGNLSDGNGPGLNTKYVGLTNQAVLVAAWPYFFKPGYASTVIPYGELFAETFAAQYGPGDGNYGAPQVDGYLNSIVYATPPSFVCSRKWIAYFTQYATPPTAASNFFPAGANCPTS